MFKSVSFEQAQDLPRWHRPIVLLILMAFAMPIVFNTWSALLNNFVIKAANFDGSDIGLLQTVCEILGFLAIGVLDLAWCCYGCDRILSVIDRNFDLNYAKLDWVPLLRNSQSIVATAMASQSGMPHASSAGRRRLSLFI